MASELEKRIADCEKEIAKLEGTKASTNEKKADSIKKVEDKKSEAIKKFDDQISEITTKFNGEIAEVDKKLSEVNSKKKKLEKVAQQQAALFAALDGIDEEESVTPSEPQF